MPHAETLAALRALDAPADRRRRRVGAEEWDVARRAWNLAVDQQPVAVVFPASAGDVATTVAFAADHGLKVACQGGGHNAGPITWEDATLLVKTERLRGITIDAPARRARVEAGVLADELAVAAGVHGLAYLAGTSPDVGIVGYAVGGGISWLVRRHGLACNSIVAVELVTADGRLVRADRDTEPDLLWAVRGGGGNFGAITALELELFPIERIYAGALFWPIERAVEILCAWRAWVEAVPEECTSLGRLLKLPELPFIPDHLRGRSFVLVEAAFLGSEADGEALVRPLRDLAPEFDTFALIPPASLSAVNMDPAEPVPYYGEGIHLHEVDARDDRGARRGGRRLAADARRGAAPRRRGGPRSPRLRRARPARRALHDPHVRARARPGGEGGGRPRARPPARSARAVGQRPPLPQLRRVADGRRDHLPARELPPALRAEGPLRPGAPVSRQPSAAEPGGRLIVGGARVAAGPSRYAPPDAGVHRRSTSGDLPSRPFGVTGRADWRRP